jgi:hypothetical protein
MGVPTRNYFSTPKSTWSASRRKNRAIGAGSRPRQPMEVMQVAAAIDFTCPAPHKPTLRAARKRRKFFSRLAARLHRDEAGWLRSGAISTLETDR